MAKILKNNTANNVFLADVGQTVPASSQLTINTSDYDKYSQSNNVITKLSDLAVNATTSTLFLNDGSDDLSISDAVDLIKGIFPNKIMGELDDVSTTDATENSKAAVRITAKRALHTNLRDSSGIEFGTSSNPINVNNYFSPSSHLLSGRLFSVAVDANSAVGNANNPIVLLRNPVDSGKTIYLHKILVGTNVTNTQCTFKLFGNPTLTTTSTSITSITQTALSTTVTVTTSGSHGATVGAPITISGTTDFNGDYTVATVTSSTIYTFTRTAVLSTTTNNSGTSLIGSSLGTVQNEYSLKLESSPNMPSAITTSLPTIPSNGNLLITMANGQNVPGNCLLNGVFVSLAPGQNTLVTANISSNNRTVTVTIIWSEV